MWEEKDKWTLWCYSGISHQPELGLEECPPQASKHQCKFQDNSKHTITMWIPQKRWPLLTKPHWESPQVGAGVSTPESVKLADPARRLQPLGHLSLETRHLTETSARGWTDNFISTTRILLVCSHVLFPVTDVTSSFKGSVRISMIFVLATSKSTVPISTHSRWCNS